MITGFNAVSTIYSPVTAPTTKGPAEATTAPGSAPIIGIRDFSLVAEDARAVLDAQYKDALEKGTNITFDTSKPGVQLDLSSLSDRAVAAIALNEGGLFSDLEVSRAGGYLSGQLQALLAPSFAAATSGDARPIMREYLGLFDQLGPEVKQALGMTEAHRIEISGVLAQKDQDLGNVQFEDGFTGLLQLLRELANEWKESHPDGYNSRGETYYSSESASRSLIL